jgi:hypothetical protein
MSIDRPPGREKVGDAALGPRVAHFPEEKPFERRDVDRREVPAEVEVEAKPEAAQKAEEADDRAVRTAPASAGEGLVAIAALKRGPSRTGRGDEPLSGLGPAEVARGPAGTAPL